jgi:hypothetical protein
VLKIGVNARRVQDVLRPEIREVLGCEVPARLATGLDPTEHKAAIPRFLNPIRIFM